MLGYSKKSQIGKAANKKSQTERNIIANKNLDAIYKQKGIDFCEVGVSKNCLKKETYSNGVLLKLTYAHRHKRVWYKPEDRRKLLYAFTETLKCCVSCHMIIEPDRKLTNQLFLKLRGTQLDRKLEGKK